VVASRGGRPGPPRRKVVSIPFIAGQWSLRLLVALRYSAESISLNPLHCGAVVASCGSPAPHARSSNPSQSPSLRGSGRFRGARRKERRMKGSLNPLHCGAVVASPARRKAGGKGGRMSQSPSLRGSGRFSAAPTRRTATRRTSQSPSLRGSGRFPISTSRERHSRGDLNPLHCGAMVASRRRPRGDPAADRRLNPLHCGAVVASRRYASCGVILSRSQSPSLRGSGRFGPRFGRRSKRPNCFNPLHCGAVVASTVQRAARDRRIRFQSPSLRGSGRFP